MVFIYYHGIHRTQKFVISKIICVFMKFDQKYNILWNIIAI